MHYGVNIKCDIHVNIISYNFSVKYAMQSSDILIQTKAVQ